MFAGYVAPYDAFAGFGHPAVVIIALVLIVSRGLVNSGAVELVARFMVAVPTILWVWPLWGTQRRPALPEKPA